MKTPTKSWKATNRKCLYRHHSDIYYARITINGKPTWRSLRTKVKGVAESKLTEMLASVAVQSELGASGVTWSLLGDVMSSRLEQVNRAPSLKASTKKYWNGVHKEILRSWPEFSELKITAVSQSDCERWAARYAKLYSGTRFNSGLAEMKRFFDMAMEYGLRQTNPAGKIRRLKPCQRDLNGRLPNSEKFREWVEAIKGRKTFRAHDYVDLVEFLAYSGLRIGEAKWVRWKHVDFERGELVVVGDPNEGTKNRELRRVPMNPSLGSLLHRIKEKRWEKDEGKLMLVTDASIAMKLAAEEVGIEPLTHHDLRHFFATICIESGVDIPTVSRWLGHKDGGALAMKVYGHLRNEHSLAAAKKVSF